MTQTIFKIKKAFLIPFNAIVVLLFLLLLISLFKGQMLEKFILAVSFVITLFIDVEAMKRKITVTDKVLRIEKFFRTKEVTWEEITQLGVVSLRNKIYFILTTIKGFYFFSNLLENHALLIHTIADKLDNERVEIEVKNYLENPIEQRSLIVICWLGVLISTAFIILKLLSF